MTKANENNTARIAGIVTGSAALDHSLYGENFYTVSALVQRLSGTVDTVPITLPERLFSGGVESLPADGDGIAVLGQLRSYNKTHATGTKLIISVFAREVRLCDALLTHENEVELTGYLCKDAVFRTTPFSREIADMLIAVNRSYNKSDYVPCIAWGRNAHFVSEMEIGTRLHIKGRLQSREYQKLLPDGSSAIRTAYELSCSSVELVQ